MDEPQMDLERMQKVIESYKEEFELKQDNDIALKCEKIIDDKMEEVTNRMTYLALHSDDERVSFQAAKYCLDNRVFYKQGHHSNKGEFADLLERLKANPINEPDRD